MLFVQRNERIVFKAVGEYTSSANENFIFCAVRLNKLYSNQKSLNINNPLSCLEMLIKCAKKTWGHSGIKLHPFDTIIWTNRGKTQDS